MSIHAAPRCCRRLAIAVAMAAVPALLVAGTAVSPALGAPARVRLAQSSAPPPKTLVTIEEQAEDIIDRAPGKRWARITQDIATIKKQWAAYQARAKADGVDPNLLDDFDLVLTRVVAAAKAKQAPDTLQAANDLSGAIVELFGSYDLGYPVQVARLDIVGRQIGFDITRAPDDVPAQIAAARAQWDAIRDEVTTRSTAVGTQVDATLDALAEADAAGKVGLLKAEVRVLLEAVDAMEELYG